MTTSASSLLLDIIACEESLYTFVQRAWPAIEGNNPFIANWHIQAICEHLEAATRGEIKKLLISVPPRTSKTTTISIMWPAWVWTRNPAVKFLFASYAQKISWEHSRLCRMLIESPWYQARWGNVVSLSKDQVTKGHFTNTATGHRIATSVGAGGTALGGDILVCLPYNTIIETSKGKMAIGVLVEWDSRIPGACYAGRAEVLSYNHLTNESEYKPVEKYEKRIAGEIYEIEFDDGSVLECTGNHPIWKAESHFYVSAEHLKEGDVVWTI